MYLSLNWLKDYVNIPKSLSAEELALRLTMHTVEIDSVINQKEMFVGVVVGKLLEVKKHPNADKLQLASVDVGTEKLNIVCGAPNIQAGQMVPVATVGSELPNGLEIKKVKVRGEESMGMLCAEDELGLGSDHSVIMVLKEGAKIGMKFSEYLKLDDVVLEVDNKSITHRPDLWSHYGIAREIATFLDIDFREYKSSIGGLRIEEKDKLEVKINDYNLCSRYMAVVVDGIRIEQSPEWIEKRLVASGMRPINNIVDITNYVMLEFGQPLHAFDRSLVDKIVIRRAKKNESIETLDSEKRELDDDILVIANSTNPMAVAGVMGGSNSEIGTDTKCIVIESANFDFLSIRKTSQALGLRTESSIRYEKSLDPNLCELGISRVLELIKEICPGAKIVSRIIDENKFTLNRGPIEIDLNWLKTILGIDIEKEKIKDILEKLGFNVDIKDDILSVIVPTWRATRDVSIKEDVVEEIARIYGYDNFSPSLPTVAMKSIDVVNPHEFEFNIKTKLAGAPGLSEVKNYSFVGEDQLKKLGIDYSTHIRLANPLAATQAMLRQSLAPSMFANVKNNQSRQTSVNLFEIGSVFLSSSGSYAVDVETDNYLPHQEKMLGIVVAEDKVGTAFSKAKGSVTYLFSEYRLKYDFETTEALPAWADRNYSAKIVSASSDIGYISRLDRKIAESYGVKKEAVFISVSLNEFSKSLESQAPMKFKEFEKYPPVVRDLAFIVDNRILYNKIRSEILSFDKLIGSVELFDVYTGESIGKGKKSLAFHIIYQADRTLKGEEIDKLQKKLIKFLEDRFEAKVRDF